MICTGFVHTEPTSFWQNKFFNNCYCKNKAQVIDIKCLNG